MPASLQDMTLETVPNKIPKVLGESMYVPGGGDYFIASLKSWVPISMSDGENFLSELRGYAETLASQDLVNVVNQVIDAHFCLRSF